MKIECKDKAETIKTEITDYPSGTIVKCVGYHFDTQNEFIGIILKTDIGEYALYDIESDNLYFDVHNYDVIKVCQGHFVLD